MTAIFDLKFDDEGVSVLVRNAKDGSPMLWIVDEQRAGVVDWEEYRLSNGVESVPIDREDYGNVEGIVRDYRRIMGLPYADR